MIFTVLPTYLLLTVSTLATSLNSAYVALYDKKHHFFGYQKYLDMCLISLFTALTLFIFGGFKFSFSAFTALSGAAFGAVAMLNLLAVRCAYKEGPLALTTVVVNFSTVFTSLSGAVLFGEKFNPLILIAIAFLITSSVFCSKKSGNEKKANFKWLIYSMLAMLSCTGIGLMQKTHQISAHKSEVIPFLIIAFLTCAALSAIVAAITRKVSRDEIIKTSEGLQKSEKELLFSKKPILSLVLYAALSGVFTSIEHSFNLYLSGVMPTAVFFPLVNGIPLVLSIVFGFILLKQKLSKNQFIGLISGVLGIVFVIILTVIS